MSAARTPETSGIASWGLLAACRGRPTVDWFPSTPAAGGRRRVEAELGYRAAVVAAKRVCGVCPVRRDCLDHAIRFREHGVWGGTTMEERAVLRGRLR